MLKHATSSAAPASLQVHFDCYVRFKSIDLFVCAWLIVCLFAGAAFPVLYRELSVLSRLHLRGGSHLR